MHLHVFCLNVLEFISIQMVALENQWQCAIIKNYWFIYIRMQSINFVKTIHLIHINTQLVRSMVGRICYSGNHFWRSSLGEESVQNLLRDFSAWQKLECKHAVLLRFIKHVPFYKSQKHCLLAFYFLSFELSLSKYGTS